ncbi:MAG: pyridoxal phosphate-dependent aminotransferase [Pseudomonadota bacterium]
MRRQLDRFPRNEIISLTRETPRYDLAESVGPDLLLRDLLQTGSAGEFDELVLGYGTAAGDPALRSLIAARQGVDAEDVVVMAGGMQALFLAAFILCEPGDQVVVASPMFPNARASLLAVGAIVREVPVTFDNGYRLDLDTLTSRLSPRTRLVSLASPQNPSGVAVPPEDIATILDAMSRTCPDAFLLVDETYREAIYGDAVPVPSAASRDTRIIVCASLSKCHGAPGIRIGWAATRDSALREQMMLGKFNTIIACSAIDEALAIRVLEDQDRIIGARRLHLKEGLDRTEAWVGANSGLVECVKPDAGALCCIRLRPEVFDTDGIDRFYEALSERSLRVARGSWFGEVDSVFRLGFGFMTMADLDQALDGLSEALLATTRQAA